MRKEKQGISTRGVLISLIVTIVIGALYFYFILPPLNPRSGAFWGFLFVLFLVYTITSLIASGVRSFSGDGSDFLQMLWHSCRVPLVLMGAVIVIAIAGQITSLAVFHAKAYYNLLDVQDGDFVEDVAEISYDKIPMLDKDSSVQLGSRALGSISSNSNLVSQFEVSNDEYSQINYQNEPVRVAPLKYGSIIKWLNNRKNGLPGYIVVNMVTQEASLVQLDEGIKYSTADHFQRNVNRMLRFNYPTMMFGDINFEIDEDGTPWWICSRTVKTIGLFGGSDTKGAVLINGQTGECTYYEEVPTWVDRVYSADLLVEQYNYHGTMVNGWVNSWLGQKGITTTTDGYNYIALNDDVYLYTGVTSVGGDESNVGFILVNQRTKDSKYYNVTGATENSAMSSAQGAVQHLGYKATFPILLNISDQPTYFMALKDSAELVKMYAMVNVSDYQITATGSSVEECQENYEALLTANGIQVTDITELQGSELETVTGRISDIRSVVIDGNTIFYFALDGEEYYVISAADCREAVTFNVGDRVTITYYPAEGDTMLDAVKIES